MVKRRINCHRYYSHTLFPIIFCGNLISPTLGAERSFPIDATIIKQVIAPKLETQDRKDLALVNKHFKSLFPVRAMKILNKTDVININNLSQENGLSFLEIGDLKGYKDNSIFQDEKIMYELFSNILLKSKGNHVYVTLTNDAVMGLGKIIPQLTENELEFLKSPKFEFLINIKTEDVALLGPFVTLNSLGINITKMFLNVILSEQQNQLELDIESDKILQICSQLDQMNNLEDLNLIFLRGNEKTQKYFNTINTAIVNRSKKLDIKKLKKLKYIFDYVENDMSLSINSQEVKSIAINNQELETLGEIDIEGKSLRELAPLKNLKEFHLCIGNNLGESEDLNALSSLIRNSRDLESLYIDIFEMTLEDEKFQGFVHEILLAINSNPFKFKKITLSIKNRISAVNVQLLMKNLSQLKNCTELFLDFEILDRIYKEENQIDLVKEILNGLKNLPKLRSFTLARRSELIVDIPNNSEQEIADSIFEIIKNNNDSISFILSGIKLSERLKMLLRRIICKHNDHPNNKEKFDITVTSSILIISNTNDNGLSKRKTILFFN